MDDRTFWDMVYTGVIAMRFHPRNVEFIDRVDVEAQCRLARVVADEALLERSERWDTGKQPPHSVAL